MVFIRFLIYNVIQKTNTNVRHGCWWGVAVEISTKNAQMKNLFQNNHLYECVTCHAFGCHFFTWSWISIYALWKINLGNLAMCFCSWNSLFKLKNNALLPQWNRFCVFLFHVVSLVILQISCCKQIATKHTIPQNTEIFGFSGSNGRLLPNLAINMKIKYVKSNNIWLN